jgi:DNA-binding transcriptional regulator YhcF (GntR family)
LQWELDKNRPICPQIEEKLSVMIASGEFKPNERLFSVREVAVRAGVNPNTVQKAFTQLEGKGLIYSVRGSGWFVNESCETAKTTVNELVRLKTQQFFEEMKALGYSDDDIKQIVKEWNE